MALRDAILDFWTCVAHTGQRSLPSFVAIRHLLREIIATSGSSYYGVTGQYGPVSVPFGDTSPEAHGTATAILDCLACVAHRAEEVARFSSLSDTYSER
ncbi:hypothetical protein DPMN_177472 [Dreissena polymorpha]|uniref:Uncharacterized protein n=1 Tax=Dreissena polymorpha TaxID=45954 RepID=A0A9D4IK81_DREPO|nr:hypothetical protein DPMN_177472 [Dreissena polymorpha]